MNNVRSAALKRIIREMDDLEFNGPGEEDDEHSEGPGGSGLGGNPASYEEGISAAPAADRTATSIPSGGAPAEASRPAEYRANVTDMPQEGASAGSPGSALPPPAAQGVPGAMAPSSREATSLSNATGSGNGLEKLSRSQRRARMRV